MKVNDLDPMLKFYTEGIELQVTKERWYGAGIKIEEKSVTSW